MQVPSSSTSAGTTQLGFTARYSSLNCCRSRVLIWTEGISIPFSATKIRTRRGPGAIENS